MNKEQFLKDLHNFIENGDLNEIIHQIIDEYGDIYLEDKKEVKK